MIDLYNPMQYQQQHHVFTTIRHYRCLLRLYDPEHLAMWDSKTPTCGDDLADYGDGVEALRFVLDWNGTLKTGIKALTVGGG